MPADRGEEDPGARRPPRLPGAGVELGDRTQQSPQPAGVIVDADHADGRQGHRAGTALTDANRAAAALAMLVAEPEAVPTAPLTFPPRKADLPAAVAHLSLSVDRERPAKINRSLLEHLGGDLMAPPKAGHLLVMVPSGA